jgi:hypothetical protein
MMDYDFDDFISMLELHDIIYLNEMPRIEWVVNLQERVKFKQLRFTEEKREWMEEWNRIDYWIVNDELMLKRKWFGFGSVCGYRRVKEEGCLKKIWKSLMCCMKKK